MARILCAWEIGDGHGHVRNLMAVASLLRAAGHAVVFAVGSSQVTAVRLVEASGWPVEGLVLPVHPSLAQYLGPMATYRANSYLDVMGLHAFDSVDRLSPLLARYRIMLQQQRIDFVLAETAPVAMVAARAAKVPCVAVGTSFGLPEVHQGFDTYPQLDHWPNTPLFTESQLLANVNKAQGTTFVTLGEAMLPHRIIPFCYPALDHYGHQRSLSHRGVGPVWQLPMQAPVTQRRGFAYLQQAYPAINDVVSSIRRSGIPFTVFVRNGTYTSAGNMQVVQQFNMQEELCRASFVVHHGSAGLGQAALSAGIAQVCFPYHVENMNNAYRLQLLGVSKAIGHQQQKDFLEFLLVDEDNRADAARVIAVQLEAHAREFAGAKVAAAAIDDLL